MQPRQQAIAKVNCAGKKLVSFFNDMRVRRLWWISSITWGSEDGPCHFSLVLRGGGCAPARPPRLHRPVCIYMHGDGHSIIRTAGPQVRVTTNHPSVSIMVCIRSDTTGKGRKWIGRCPATLGARCQTPRKKLLSFCVVVVYLLICFIDLFIHWRMDGWMDG